jgi:branched-chain amino acid aminotransferase
VEAACLFVGRHSADNGLHAAQHTAMPRFQDSHNNLINNILAKIESNHAGVDDALMLDIQGFVSETNATNVFLVRSGQVLTPHADSCLPGITRKVVMEICADEVLPMQEKNLSLTEVYTADEMFATGTMGGSIVSRSANRI